jgi:hypothetical protein
MSVEGESPALHSPTPAVAAVASPAGPRLPSPAPIASSARCATSVAVAGHDVIRADAAAQGLADLSEHLVARLMAVAVVHLLELVEVDQHERQRVARALGALELAMERIVHRRVVEAAREGVGARSERELGVRARVAARRGGQIAECLQQRELVARGAAAVLEAHGDRAAQAPVPAQRDGRRAVCEQWRLGHLRRLADALGGPAVGGLRTEAAALVPEQHAGVVRAHQTRCLLADVHKHAARVEALVESPDGIEEARGALHHG